MRRKAVALVAVALVSPTSGCASLQSSATEVGGVRKSDERPVRDGGTLTVALNSDPDKLDPTLLSVSFRSDARTVHAVDRVSYDLLPGEVLAVVGESGCGKSVTSMAVMGLLPPTARIGGSIRLGGRELAGASEEELQKVRGKDIAMIFQEPMTSLNPVLTIGRQIGEVLRRHRGMSRKEARARAVELLDLVGIPAPRQRVEEYPHQLSGGMRQRVMIAIAVARDPAVLIADEPTTALDVTVQAGILRFSSRCVNVSARRSSWSPTTSV